MSGAKSGKRRKAAAKSKSELEREHASEVDRYRRNAARKGSMQAEVEMLTDFLIENIKSNNITVAPGLKFPNF